jgi:LysM repeat protein
MNGMSVRLRAPARRTQKLVLVLGAFAAFAPLTVAIAAGQSHVIQPGETLSDIADRYGLSVAEIMSLNGIGDPDLIYAGESLSVDAQTAVVAPVLLTHLVVPGDTLSSIALEYGVSVEALVSANNIEDRNSITIDRLLIIPVVTQARHSAAQAAGKVAVRAAEAEFGLPPGLLLALAWQESGWNQAMVSYAGAIGVTQIMPETADWALETLAPDAVNWRTSATDNARLGASILRSYLDRTGGDVRLSLAAYYQGWRSIEIRGIYEETGPYVTSILALQSEFE